MKQIKKDKTTKERKIRKILLINSDIEMRKKIRAKKYVLINSMTPIQLESLFQVNNQPINILISTYTNVIEKHIVEKIVDIPKNINYFYSDMKDNTKEKKENKLKKYKHLYSAKNFYVNYENLINEEEKEKLREKENEEVIIEHIIPFISKKKSVGEEKIKGSKSITMLNIGQKHLFEIIKKNSKIKIKSNINNNKININFDNNNEEKKENNIGTISSSNCNSISEESCDKCEKNKNKTLDINNKLIYYCYTNLKRKRPLMVKKSNTSNSSTIYGLQIEEEFYKKNKNLLIKKTESKKQIKFEHIRRSKTNKEIKRGSSKKRSLQKQKRKDTMDINARDLIKKRRLKTVAYKNHVHNEVPPTTHIQNNISHIHSINIEHKVLKSLAKKFQSIKSEKKNPMKYKELSQYAKDKRRANSIERKNKCSHTIKNNNNNDNDNTNLEKIKIQNIISKADTKTSSFDNSSNFFSLEKKNKYNNIYIHKSTYKKKKKKTQNFKKRTDSIIRNIKFTNLNKYKPEFQEEIKEKKNNNSKKHKQSLNEPIKVINSLKMNIGLECDESNIKEKSKIINMKNPPLKFSTLDKIKTLKFKSKKHCMSSENICYEDDFYYFNKHMHSNTSKERNKGESMHIKKANIIKKG